jgi:hypothetical protein
MTQCVLQLCVARATVNVLHLVQIQPQQCTSLSSVASPRAAAAVAAEAGTKLWADRMGCPGAGSSPKAVYTDAGAGVKCTNMCGGQQTTAVLCALEGVGHGVWDKPGAGYVAGLALWAFGGFSGSPKSL